MAHSLAVHILRDLRVAKLAKQDLVIKKYMVTACRVRAKVSFMYWAVSGGYALLKVD